MAGVSSCAAFSFLFNRLDFIVEYPFAVWSGYIALLIALDIFGLLSFSIGRSINGFIFRMKVLGTYLWNAINGQNLKNEIIDSIKQPLAYSEWRLYIRL